MSEDSGPFDDDWRDEFRLDPGLHYLNHAAVAPWPRRTQEAVIAFAADNVRHGARNYEHWLATEKRLRERLARLVHASSCNEIALLKNTSEALSVVAYGLDWRPGDRIVITDQEFPSNRIVWESLRERFGVHIDYARLSPDIGDPEQAVIDAIGEDTRLVSLSAVEYGTGLRFDLARIGRACHDARALFCIDAIQAVGALDIDVEACGADFLMADGHKWMLGPEGLALFYCREEHLERLQLHEFGWHMVEAMGDFDATDWTIARSARRFEAGSPNMLGIHALDASIGLLLEIGMTTVQSRVLAHQRLLARALADDERYRLLSPVDAHHDSGILTLMPVHEDEMALYHRLTYAGVCCARRGGGIRLSPHFYTPPSSLEYVLELLDSPP